MSLFFSSFYLYLYRKLSAKQKNKLENKKIKCIIITLKLSEGVMKSTRKEALLAGESEYFTGKPCKNGHVLARDTLSGRCPKCQEIYVKRDRELFEKAKAAKAG